MTHKAKSGKPHTQITRSLKISLSLWQAEPTYLDDELNDGPNLSDMISWKIRTASDRELQSRNPQGFDGNQSAGYPSGPRNSMAMDAAVCHGL